MDQDYRIDGFEGKHGKGDNVPAPEIHQSVGNNSPLYLSFRD
jgi:hypothetical protein